MTTTAPKFKDFSEAEIAGIFVEQHVETIRYLPALDQFWQQVGFEGWRRIDLIEVEALLMPIVDAARAEAPVELKFQLGSAAFVDNVTRQLRRDVAIWMATHPKGEGWVIAESLLNRECVSPRGTYFVEKV